MQVIQEVAKWMGIRGRSFVDPDRLSLGIKDLSLREGQHVHSRSTIGVDAGAPFPLLFCAQFSHVDDKVSGRRWVTEVGLRQVSVDSEVECTVLLKTDEISARVTSPVQVTRPQIVAQLVAVCNATGDTPGIRVKVLDEGSARGFIAEVERVDRPVPLVVVSCNRDGRAAVAPDRLRSILVGIADVVEVPATADTFSIEQIVGRRYGAWGGAINLIFPVRKGRDSCETILFLPGKLEELVEDGKSVESEILAAVTHRTNLSNSWLHVSLDTVGQARLRTLLAKSISNASGSAELAEYSELLEAADAELQAKSIQLLGLQDEISELLAEAAAREEEVGRHEATILSLKHSLSARQGSMDDDLASSRFAEPIRDAISGLISEDIELEQCLALLEAMCSERVVVLPSAFQSAVESDEKGFRYGERAFRLIWNLGTKYWEALSSGVGDQQARMVFGNSAYAANESDNLSKAGSDRRTFEYRGRKIEMLRHLKIGVKDNSAETLRVHFEWLADEKRIVIGHCGKHLDF